MPVAAAVIALVSVASKLFMNLYAIFNAHKNSPAISEAWLIRLFSCSYVLSYHYCDSSSDCICGSTYVHLCSQVWIINDDIHTAVHWSVGAHCCIMLQLVAFLHFDTFASCHAPHDTLQGRSFVDTAVAQKFTSSCVSASADNGMAIKATAKSMFFIAYLYLHS